jgi:hypothetical protein
VVTWRQRHRAGPATLGDERPGRRDHDLWLPY